MRALPSIRIALLLALASACAGEPAPAGATGAAPLPDAFAFGDALADAKGAADAQSETATPGDATAEAAGDAATESDALADSATDAATASTQDAVPEGEATDGQSETAADSAGPAAGDVAPGDVGPSPWPPVDQWGPYTIGTRVKNWVDPARGNRPVTTRLWYPVVEKGGDKATYFDAILLKVQGKALDKGTADKAKGPFPVVLFSHGFKGINWQSYDYTEYLASHGYVVAAPDHAGNTLFDVSVSKETESKSALERPIDVRFAYDELVKLNGPGGGDFEGLLDLGKVAVTGHSFGGYTALVVAGATVDVDAAKAGCKSASNMLCKGGYMNYWPDGTTLKIPKPIPALKTALCLAPGFHVAFGKAGLQGVNVPTVLFGGTLDGTTPVDSDIAPLYADLPSPKGKVVITGAGHMSYTNVCSLPPAQFVAELKDMCFKPGMIDGAKAFALTNAFAVAWLNRWVKGDLAQNKALQSELPAKFAAAATAFEGL